MRLTIVNQFYPPDVAPTGKLAADLAEHRARLGDEVTIVASHGGYRTVAGEVREVGERENLRVRRVWTPRLGKRNALCRCLDYLAFFVLAAWRMLRLPRQDAILCMTTPPFVVCTALLHKLLHRKTRILLWSMDCYPEAAERDGLIRSGGLVSRLLRAVNRFVYRRLDCVIGLDTAMVEMLRDAYEPRQRELPMVVIPNWERLEQCPPNPQLVPLSDDDARLFADKFVTLYTGNRGRGHHFDAVFDVADALRDEPIRFCFVGGGARTEEMRQTIAARKLSNVVLLDYVKTERLHALMHAADCALITLREEMQGVMSPGKLHANLALGLPVIYLGPTYSNVDEAIRRFGCGVSLRQHDAAGLLAFLRRMMANPLELAPYRARARRAFERAYCDQRTLPQFDALLDGAAIEVTEDLPTRKAA